MKKLLMFALILFTLCFMFGCNKPSQQVDGGEPTQRPQNTGQSTATQPIGSTTAPTEWAMPTEVPALSPGAVGEDRVVLSVPVGTGENEFEYEFVASDETPDTGWYEAPDAYAIADDNSIYVYSVTDKAILHFVNGELSNSIDVSELSFFSDGTKLCYGNGYLYSVDYVSVVKIDVATGGFTRIALPPLSTSSIQDNSAAYLRVRNLYFADGSLYIRYDDNRFKRYDDESDMLVQANELYGAVRGDKNTVVKRGENNVVIEIDSDDFDVKLIGYGNDGSIYLSVFDSALSVENDEWWTIRRYSWTGELLSIRSVTREGWLTDLPHFPEYISNNGKLYLMMPLTDKLEIHELQLNAAG